MSTRLLLCALLLCTHSFSQTTNAFRVNYDLALFDLPGNAVEALTPSNYVFAGTNLNFLPIYGTITQVDNLGALVWSKRYSDASIGFQINDIKKDPVLSEYYVCGGSESNSAVFMRVNAAGGVVVSKKFSISQADGAYLNRVVKTSDGGYVAVGYVTGYDPDGAGPEIKFSPINYTDANGDPQTEVISSPLIVKFDANGNHLWHHVFRYYTAATKTSAQRIYNDASLNDVVEVADGYIAVGQYDVNDHNTNTNSDGDDATSNDAVIIKTTTAGVITYHKQVDTPNTNASAASKYLTAISKTTIGDPIAAGSDNGKELIMKYGASGGFSLTFSRDFTYSSFFGTPDPVDISQIYEVDGGTDLVTMGMYIKPLSFVFANSIHRVNPTATTNVWSKYYTFNLATILPRGGKTSDGGYIMNSTVMGGANFDYHLIKTDPTGETPISGCAAVSFTPTASAGPSTIADPYVNNWSGTVGPQTLTVVASTVTPTTTVQCTYTACVAPTAPVIGTITQPTCSVAAGSVALSGLPSTGTWTVTASPGGATITGTGTTGNFTGLTAGTTYTFIVTNAAGCTSVASSNAIINAQPVTPTAPVIGTITQPTCAVATGSVALSGLPSSGTWTVTASPGGATITGTGTTGNFTGLTAGTTYTFTVTNTAGCTSVSSANAIINSQPTTPTTPVIGTITQPTCSLPTGSVELTGLPSSGTWTVTISPGGATSTGTGTTTTISGLTAGTTYTFTVTNAASCTSSSSTNGVINSQPTSPTAPIVGVITQPTCSVATGSIDLNGLPSSGTWTVTASPGSATTTGTGTTTTITGLTAGTTYTFTVTNAAGCTSAASTNVVIDVVAGAPVIALDNIQNVNCNGGSTGEITISITGGQAPYSYQWTPNVGTTPTISGLIAGDYTVLITDDLGCTATATYTVTQGSLVIIDATIVDVICETSLGSISTNVSGGTGPYTYSWTPNGEITPNIIDLAGGSYGATMTDFLGCNITENYTIGITGSISIDADPNFSSINAGESVPITVTGGTNYNWTPPTGLSCTNCSNPIATPFETTTYYVTSTDSSGCTGGDTVLIEIKIECGDFYVPNIFSPNGDMNNDYLCIYGTCIRELKYAVYDRWGEKVFETEFAVNLDTKNYHEVCWDGTYKGKPLNSGVYAYKIYAALDNGEIIEESGNITLVK
jgi:gliding motility-associated-like protein